MTAPIAQQVDTLAGRTSTNTFIAIIESRAPTGNDGINNGLQVGQRWIDTSDDNQEYFLLGFIASNGFVQANWVKLGGSQSTESITATSPLTANGVSGSPVSGDVTLSFSNSVVDGVLVTNNTGVASFLPNSGTPGYVLTANSAAPPSWQTNASGFSAASITVSPIAGQGNFTTITAALAAAVSGQDILIKAGTYTENLTLKAGVNLVAWEINSDTPIVTVIGKFSYSAAGTCSISGIRLQTNSDFLLEVTGSSGSIVNLKHCYLNCTNNTGINFSSSSGSSIINIYDSSGNLTTTGITHYTSSSPGNLIFVNSGMANTGLSVVASNNSAGIATIANSSIQCPVSTSVTGRINIGNSQINRRDTNSVALTLNGTDLQTFVEINSTTLLSGTATAMIVGAGVDITAAYVTIESSNVNAIDGAGTLRYADLIFSGSSSKINTTTQVVLPSSEILVRNSIDAGGPQIGLENTSSVVGATARNVIATAANGATSDAYTLVRAGTLSSQSWEYGVEGATNDFIFQAAPANVNPYMDGTTVMSISQDNKVTVYGNLTASEPEIICRNLFETSITGQGANIIAEAHSSATVADVGFFSSGQWDTTKYWNFGMTSTASSYANAFNISYGLTTPAPEAGLVCFSIKTTGEVTIPLSLAIGTAGPTITSGTGAPGAIAPQGSLYLRKDGTGVNDRAYINTDGAATWTAIVTVA